MASGIDQSWGFTKYNSPTDTGAANLDCDLSRLQTLTTLYILGLGSCLSNPKIMVGVGVDTNVGLGHGSCGRHCEMKGGIKDWQRERKKMKEKKRRAARGTLILAEINGQCM